MANARSLHALTGWRETPGTALAVPPPLILTNKAGARPAHRSPALLGLSILLLPDSSTSLLQPLHHVLGYIFSAALGDQQCPREGDWEHCVIRAQAHPPTSPSSGRSCYGCGKPSRAAQGSFHLLPSLVHWEANMAIFILVKCSCSGRQARDALPG